MIRRLIATSTGEPQDVLRLASVDDDPPPGPGQVTLAVHAVGLNFLDVSLCRGEYPVRPSPPMTPGVEASGRVIAGDPAWIGREVVACPALPFGALGETVTIDADLVVERPPSVNPVVAAALPVTYQTSWFALERARVKAGDTVLVHAGAGGVGIATIQLAVARGARVIATASSVEKRDKCREEGASIAVGYEEFESAAGEVDVVIDPVGGDLLGRSLDCLAFEGRLVSVGMAAGPPPPVDPARLIARNVDLIGLSWGSRYPWARPAEVRAAYDELFRRCATGELRPSVNRVVPLDQAPAALADLAARRTTGKVIVQVTGFNEEAS
ncbi:NADPH:quinone oxidoreductase family protein [Actinoplanes sp. LDG1-06]|uniref:NADPH:quinone oxidoreductase family protein n=1 Tax=Paractinoplanes ovalisporus TaxID=2810368 RepID=A0ABS2AFP6_9ACTN|nr:NADPH:quinone oxidoreductase family protein [Actinoplanes ovalisporus]MBM2618640.1 NADPH:quinone oxidoreductase family protein [Actinoplanes ovalisporus]